MLWKSALQKILNFKILKSPLRMYINAVGFTIIALALSALFWNYIHDAPFLFFYGAVVVSAWRGGLGPGILSTLVAIFSIDFFLIEPLFVVFTNVTDILQLAIFSLISFLIMSLEQGRNESQRALREVKEQLEIILDSVADGITAQDKDGRVIFANLSAAQLTGYSSPEVLINTPIKDIRPNYEMFGEEEQAISYSSLPRHHVFKHKERADLIFKMHFISSQDDKWIHLTSSPVFDTDGKVKLSVNIFRDITQQIETEQTLSRYGEIILNSNDAIIGQSLQGNITSWNPSAEQLYGYTADEVIGQSIEVIFPPDIKERESKLIDRLNTGEKIKRYETRRRHKNGYDVDISLTLSPIRTSKGKIIGYSTIEHNITSQKLLEMVNKEAEERLRNTVDNLAVFIGMVQTDGTLLEANRSVLEVANLKPEDVLGKPFDETYWWSFSEESRSRLRQAISRAAQGETDRYDAKVRLSENSYMSIDFMIAPIFDDEGQVKYLIPSGFDITERIQLYEELQEEKRKVTSMLNSIPGIVYEGSGDFDASTQNMDFISNYAEQMLGYSLEEWHSVPNFWKEVVHPDDWDTTVFKANLTYEQGIAGPVSFRCITKDNQVLYTEAYNGILTNEQGQRYGTCGVILDVTERMQREQEIMRLTSVINSQRHQLESILLNVPGIIFDMTYDTDKGKTVINFISDYLEKMLGYPSDAWRTNLNFWEKLVHPDDVEKITADATIAFESNQPGSTQFRCYDAEGNVVFVEAYFMFSGEAPQVHQFGVIMDITARKAIEDALNVYMEDLKRSNDELEQFAYVASHDLQEPLRMITSYLQLIEKRYSDKLDEDGKDFIDFAVDGASRMKMLINDLLTYSRIQRDDIEFSDVDMQQVLEQVLYNLQLNIEESKAVIIHDDLPFITANERQMVQLLQNLISNAIKFHGEEPPKIHVNVQGSKRHWQFSIRDNGIGIDSEYFDRIFIIFQRLQSREDYPGTGIGLAICRKIIDKHNGKIWLESKHGEGTTFHFTIPITQRNRIFDFHENN